MHATLLVVANATSQGDLVRLFRRCGFDVEAACGGPKCIDRVRSEPPDVLVLELDVPFDTESAKLLGALSPKAEAPFVIVLGNSPAESLSRCTGIPEGSCFEKPLRLEDVLDRVGLAAALIDMRRNRQPRVRPRRPCYLRCLEACLN